MGLDYAKKLLREMGTISAQEQSYRKSEIEEAFYVFWGTSPTREEFSDVMNGVLLTARILWTMSPPIKPKATF